ncbi:MinD/ParA family protein [Acidithiobacillus acidisediminis]|uniref:MinD/ParA family protein n=1 Tax=Acidithiobacillus acidisediminis TaxID=2937799 RepID=UPI00200E5B3B|nr:MinD/ParA family protein [Acidithiobacillus sp. S30A2]
MAMNDWGDQAEGLRRMQTGLSRVLAIASGKGGVGKTNLAVNLALALAARRKRPLLFDADLGLGNIDVLLGLSPRFHLAHVLAGEKTLAEIILPGPQGIEILPAASGIADMANLDVRQQSGLLDALAALEKRYDYLILDLAAGIGSDVLRFSQAADHVLVVVTNEPASITDAYAYMKVMRRDHGLQNFWIIPNMVRDAVEGEKLFSRLAAVARQYLELELRHAGNIPMDPYLRSAVRTQQPLLQRFPDSAAAKAYRALADTILTWPAPAMPAGGGLFSTRLLFEEDQSG